VLFRSAQALLREGISVSVYDPAGMEAAKKNLDSSVQLCNSMKECIHDADTIVITTPWKEFGQIPALLNAKRIPVLIDCWRMLKQLELNSVTEFIQLGIGKDDYKLD